MNKDIEIIEVVLFSGIGGFSLGLAEAGLPIVHHYYSEVDKHAVANYSYNFKNNSTYVGSVTNVRHILRTVNTARNANTRIILTFGSPCQDFSLAGKRGGLNGSKSSLIKYALFLIKWLRPDVYIWENVKGAFSTNDGADFWAILQAFANIGDYTTEWQLLNTAWLLPQNRERIYAVGHLGGRSIPGVFPIGEEISVPPKAQPSHRDSRVMPTLIALYDKIPTDGAYIRVTSATTDGYEVAEIGDSINYSVPTSETRRGRVGKGVAQTLDTQCNQGPYTQEGLRRYTENEAEALQGFPKDWTKYGTYNGVVKEVSRGNRYKMCGNAVTVDVVKEIGKRLKIN